MMANVHMLVVMASLSVGSMLLYLASAICSLQKDMILVQNSISEMNFRFRALREPAKMQIRSQPIPSEDYSNKTARSDDFSERVSHLENVASDTEELLLTYIRSRAPPVKEMATLEQDNPKIVEFIKDNLLVAPPTYPEKPPVEDTSRGNGPRLLHIFQNKTGGFFVECGALDGTWLSNTFYLERLLNWTGVLIEADAINFKTVLDQKRNVISVPTCLSRSTKPQLVPFTFGNFAYSRIVDDAPMTNKTDNVLCMPFFSILLALNRTTVDLFSLDIEGHELDILKTIPWEKVDIKVLIVEFLNIKEGKKALEDFMSSKGYANFPSTPEERGVGKWAEDDYIFVKKGSGLKES